jgi:hypothetical protein
VQSLGEAAAAGSCAYDRADDVAYDGSVQVLPAAILARMLGVHIKVMAGRGMFSTTDLLPPLKERGIERADAVAEAALVRAEFAGTPFTRASRLSGSRSPRMQPSGPIGWRLPFSLFIVARRPKNNQSQEVKKWLVQ